MPKIKFMKSENDLNIYLYPNEYLSPDFDREKAKVFLLIG